MNSFQLKVDAFPLQQITEFQMTKQVNDHIYLMIKGILNKDNAEEILERKKYIEEISVTLIESGSENVTLFRGIIKEISISMEGQIYNVKLQAVSYTYLLDQEKKFRTFQNVKQTYKDLVKEVLASYDAAVIYPCGEEKIETMQVQYQETDWEFLKRMASQLHTVLVADSYIDKAAFYFGMREGKKDLQLPVESCTVRDCVTYESRYREYEFVSSCLAELGDKTIYHKMSMQIYKFQLCLVQQELKYIYHLRSHEKCKKKPYNNFGLVGVSLKGKVVDVDHNKLRISIEGDKGLQIEKRWFDYATVYSSPEGNAWYFMPEKGDEIRLYFPDEKAEHAYVLNTVHTGEPSERKNPECKFIRTKRNQEIRFTPGQIKITNHKGMSIVLDDEEGIELKSNKNIILEAGQSIELNSGGVVAVKGKSAVILKQSNNMIAVRNGIREQGVRIERQ